MVFLRKIFKSNKETRKIDYRRGKAAMNYLIEPGNHFFGLHYQQQNFLPQ